MDDNLWWLQLQDPGVQAFLKKNDLTPTKWARLLLERVYEEPPVPMREFLFSPDFADWKGDLWPNVQAILEEFDKPTYREGYFAIGRGCIAAGSEVYDANTGLWRRVEGVKNDFVSVGYNEGRCGISPATGFRVSGRGKILKVELAGGLSVRVYQGHRFLGREYSKSKNWGHVVLGRSKTRWVKAGELKVGELVAVSRRVYINNPVESMTSNEAFFLGAMIGDGSFPGIRKGVAHNKTVPDLIYSLPDTHVAKFLEGLFSTDGWCGRYKYHDKRIRKNTKGYQYQIGYVSKSKELVEGVRRLLLRFGVASRVYRKVSREFRCGDKTYGFAWVLQVVGTSNRRRFANSINIIGCEEVLKSIREEKPVSLEEDDFYWVRVKSVVGEGEGEYYDCSVPGVENYIHDGGVVGHNSGKSAMGSLFLARAIYWLLNLKDPWSYYSLRKNTLLTVLNVSVSGVQAQSVVFDTLCAVIENSRYFNDKFSKRTALGHADMFFPSKRVRAISGHSGSTVWRGYAIYAAVADELSWFVSKANKDNGEDICQVLKGSMKTRFSDSYKFLAISSLKSRTDYLCKTVTGLRKEVVQKAGQPETIEDIKRELAISDEK